jgi:hypothetical protein
MTDSEVSAPSQFAGFHLITPPRMVNRPQDRVLVCPGARAEQRGVALASLILVLTTIN